MEEVRSYWQVASISHFCTIFGKPFKLPSFEPEELEQAFIIHVPVPPVKQAATNGFVSSSNNHQQHNNINSNDNQDDEHCDDRDSRSVSSDIKAGVSDGESVNSNNRYSNNNHTNNSNSNHNLYQTTITTSSTTTTTQNNDEQTQELHLLVKLAIALIRPHFNTRISHANWETYLRRLVDMYWVDLEHHPSPFCVPLISEDGVIVNKNLTFNELQLSDKIDLFYALCDYRLWCEDCADALKDFTLEELRLEHAGKDSHGYEYWYFSGTRLFRENKELSQDLILRKKRIIELEYKLIELEKLRILKEQEDKRRLEIERAKKLAAEAREARSELKRQQEQEKSIAEQKKRRKSAAPVLPPRTGLRERRTSSTSNNDSSKLNLGTPTTRSSRQNKQLPPEQQPQQNESESNSRKSTLSRSSKTASSKHNQSRKEVSQSPELPKKPPEEECRDELNRLTITAEDRAESWTMICDSLEEWEEFAIKFDKSKSSNEKYLTSYVNQNLLPHIRAVYAKRAAEARRKEKELLLSLTSRRVSTRIISKKAQEEEDERQAMLHEEEMRRRKMEGETRLRAELEREMRARKFRVTRNNGASSSCSENGDDNNGRYNLRQAPKSPSTCTEFDGIINPDKLSEVYEGLELVIDTVRISKHAWPFVAPVPDSVPGYYDLIEEPMDLRTIRTKIEFREYISLDELVTDFQLIVNNCERFNGPKNVYTKMVYKLWKSFKKNVKLYLQRDLSIDERDAFVFPPETPETTEVKLETHQELIKEGDIVNNLEPDADLDRPAEIEEKKMNLESQCEPIETEEVKSTIEYTYEEVPIKTEEVEPEQESKIRHLDEITGQIKTEPQPEIEFHNEANNIKPDTESMEIELPVETEEIKKSGSEYELKPQPDGPDDVPDDLSDIKAPTPEPLDMDIPIQEQTVIIETSISEVIESTDPALSGC